MDAETVATVAKEMAVNWAWPPKAPRFLGLLVIVAGAGLFLFTRWWASEQYDVPLDAPIRVFRGYEAQYAFEPKLTDEYELCIEAARNDSSATDSLLGMTYREANAADSLAPSQVNIEWRLSTAVGGEQAGLAIGRNAGYLSSRGVTGRVLGRVALRRGHQYRLEVEVRGGGPELDALSPRIRLERHPSRYEGVSITVVASWVLGGLMAIAGLMLLRPQRAGPHGSQRSNA